MGREKNFDTEKVLEVAMELFWTKGFHATSMDDLVKYLGINRSSVYSFLGCKKEIFLKGISLYQERNLNGIKYIFAQEKTVTDGFCKLFEHAIKNTVADKEKRGCLIVNSSTELIPGDPDFQAFLQHNKDSVEKEFAGQLQKGIDSGEFKNIKNPNGMAHLLFTLSNGIGVLSKLKSKPDETNFILESVVQILGINQRG